MGLGRLFSGMAPTDDRDGYDSRDERRSSETTRGDRPAGGGVAAWFAASTFRIGLAFIGLVLLLFALGQMAGIDLLGMVVEALSTQVGLWLTVAVFALLLIALALRGFGTTTD